MSYPLAIFSSWVGVPSETFIRRHMQDLLPGGTVGVAWDVDRSSGGGWSVDGPVLVLRALPRVGLGRRLLGAAARGLGWRSPPRAEAVKQFLQEHQVSVIMAEYLHHGVEWMDFARKLGIRFFGHAHGYDVSRLLRTPEVACRVPRV